MRRTRAVDDRPFDHRLFEEAQRLREKVQTIKPGAERDALLLKVRQLETAANIGGWLNSSGLAAPIDPRAPSHKS